MLSVYATTSNHYRQLLYQHAHTTLITTGKTAYTKHTMMPTNKQVLSHYGTTPETIQTRYELECRAFEEALRWREGWFEVLAGREWTLAQLAEHVLLVNTSVSKCLYLIASDRPLDVYPRTPGVMKDAKAQAPEGMQPDGELDRDAFLKMWQGSYARLLKQVAAMTVWEDESRTMYHPFFGDLTALAWFQMAAFHVHYHHKQLS